MPAEAGAERREGGWSPSRESKPALPFTRRLHRLNASGARKSHDEKHHANGQTDGASAAHPEKRGRLHEAPSNSGRSRCQTAKVSFRRPRARDRAAHARVVRSFDARVDAIASARDRFISGFNFSVLWAHRVPPAWWRRVVARRRLVRLSRSL